MKQGIKPRAPPGHAVRLSAECRALIVEAYPLPAGTDILLSIEFYIDRLNSQGRTQDALDFLRECEIGARIEIQARSKQKSRDVLKLVGNSAFTASLGVIVKYVSIRFGIS